MPKSSASAPSPIPAGALHGKPVDPAELAANPPPAAPSPAEGAAKPTTAAELVGKDTDNLGGSPELPPTGTGVSQPAPGGSTAPAQPTTAASMVAADPDKTLPEGGGAEGAAGRGRPRLEDTPERLRQRDKYNRLKPGGAAGKPTPGKPALPPSTPPTPPPPPVNYDQMATMIVSMSCGSLVNFFGPEWAPRILKNADTGDVVMDERQSLINATSAYLRAKGAVDLPPGLMLTLVISSYAAPRFAVPSTRQKMTGIWKGITGFVGRMFGRAPKPPKGEAQPIKQVEETGDIP